MAIVEHEYTRWPGHNGMNNGDFGRIVVYANDTGQRNVDRVEIDNQQCSDRVRVQVYDDDGATLLFDRTVEPGMLFTYVPPVNVSWRRNVQQKISQWDVRISTDSV